MSSLTDTQRTVLDCMRSYQRKHGNAPTLREIGERTGLVYNGAKLHDALEGLTEIGHVRRDVVGKYRSWRARDPVLDALGVALDAAPEMPVVEVLRIALVELPQNDEAIVNAFHRFAIGARAGAEAA